jgi:putative PIN family toxin of toxin-antitoxin system
MRIVLDTNILARAASGPPGPAAELLLRAMQEPHILCVSPFLLAELSRVLRYERVRRIHGMTDDEIDQYLQNIQLASVVVEPAPDATMSIVTADPDDDPIVATAIAASAEVLCTLDRHLHTPAVVSYCRQHGIEVVGDVELLRRWKSPSE